MNDKYQRIDVSGKRVVTFEAESPCLVHAAGGASFSGKKINKVMFLKKGDRVSAHGPGYISVVRPGASEAFVRSCKVSATSEAMALVLEGVKRRIQSSLVSEQSLDSILVDLTLLEVDLSRSIAALLQDEADTK